MQRMRIERKSGLMFKGRRVPFGDEILVEKPREAKILEAIKAASPIVDDESPRQVAAVLKAPSLARGGLVDRMPAAMPIGSAADRELFVPAYVTISGTVTRLEVNPAAPAEESIAGEGVPIEVNPAARALFPAGEAAPDIPPGEDSQTAQESASESSVDPHETADEEVSPEAGEAAPVPRKGRGGRKAKTALDSGTEGAQ